MWFLHFEGCFSSVLVLWMMGKTLLRRVLCAWSTVGVHTLPRTLEVLNPPMSMFSGRTQEEQIIFSTSYLPPPSSGYGASWVCGGVREAEKSTALQSNVLLMPCFIDNAVGRPQDGLLLRSRDMHTHVNIPGVTKLQSGPGWWRCGSCPAVSFLAFFKKTL